MALHFDTDVRETAIDDLLEEAPEAPPRQPTSRPTRRRRWPFVVALLLAPLVAFGAVYLLFFTPDSPPRLTLSTIDAGAADSSVDVPLGRWAVGTDSVAGYRVREKLLRLPAPNDGVGRTSQITGGFTLGRQGSSYVVGKGLRIEVDVASLRSDEDRRDDHMRTMGLETDRYPTATFESNEDLVLAPGAGDGGWARTSIVGDLTIHGATKRVSIPVEAQVNGGRIEVVGSLTFNWDLFEITAPNLSYVTVESTATLEFQLLFAYAGA